MRNANAFAFIFVQFLDFDFINNSIVPLNSYVEANAFVVDGSFIVDNIRWAKYFGKKPSRKTSLHRIHQQRWLLCNVQIEPRTAIVYCWRIQWTITYIGVNTIARPCGIWISTKKKNEFPLAPLVITFVLPHISLPLVCHITTLTNKFVGVRVSS